MPPPGGKVGFDGLDVLEELVLGDVLVLDEGLDDDDPDGELVGAVGVLDEQAAAASRVNEASRECVVTSRKSNVPLMCGAAAVVVVPAGTVIVIAIEVPRCDTSSSRASPVSLR